MSQKVLSITLNGEKEPPFAYTEISLKMILKDFSTRFSPFPRVCFGFKKFRLGNNMTSVSYGNWKFYTADPGARTPIGASGNQFIQSRKLQ